MNGNREVKFGELEDMQAAALREMSVNPFLSISYTNLWFSIHKKLLAAGFDITSCIFFPQTFFSYYKKSNFDIPEWGIRPNKGHLDYGKQILNEQERYEFINEYVRS